MWFRGRRTTSIRANISRALAGLEALEKAVGVQRSNVAAAEANLARIERMQNLLSW